MVYTNQNKYSSDYWGELSLRFQREHIEYGAPEDNWLPILWKGQEIGMVTPDGSLRIQKKFINDADVSELNHRAGEISA